MHEFPRARRSTLWLAGGALLTATAGCSLRDDPHYNRFSPHGSNPTVMQRTDRLRQAAETGLDNAERRVENIIE